MSKNENIMMCVFCGLNTTRKIVLFTSETLEKCKTVLEYRRSKPMLRKIRTTYVNVELPAQTSLNQGYHAKCYKLFTAIKISSDFIEIDMPPLAVECELEVLDGPATAMTIQTDTISTNKGSPNNFDDQLLDRTKDPLNNERLLPSCFICGKTNLKRHGIEVPMAVNKCRTIELLTHVATESNDVEMLEKVSSYSIDADVPYHKYCKDQYLRDVSRKGSKFLIRRKALNTAYVALCEMLEEDIVNKKECMFFDKVKNVYQKLLVKQTRLLSDAVSTSFSDRHLHRKLMETFYQKIKFICAGKKKLLIPFSANIHDYILQK